VSPPDVTPIARVWLGSPEAARTHFASSIVYVLTCGINRYTFDAVLHADGTRAET
jgi:hypothetical protein